MKFFNAVCFKCKKFGPRRSAYTAGWPIPICQGCRKKIKEEEKKVDGKKVDS